MSTTINPVDPVTERIRGIWTSGDFGRIAVGYAPGSAEFVARLCLLQGERVLDVACGTGNLSIPAAQAGALTTGVDIAPNLIEQAMENAAKAGIAARFEVGDAESLPCSDGSFDTTMTMFGAMFAARPDRAAAELLRVTRLGGRIAMANWTPTGFIGQMLKVVVGYVPPPPGAISVLQWGDEKIVRERLAGVQKINCIPRRITFNYPHSPAETVRLFLDWYGPTLKAYQSLNATGREAFERDLIKLWTDNNRATDGQTRVESEYLEVIAIR